jgi:GTPase SAR1 family protein
METVPTIGLNIETVKYKDLEFLVFDIGGKVRSLWSHYYENIDAIIFVIDSTDKERVMIVKDELVKLNGDIQF